MHGTGFEAWALDEDAQVACALALKAHFQAESTVIQHVGEAAAGSNQKKLKRKLWRQQASLMFLALA